MGVTASSIGLAGQNVAYSLAADSSGGGFTIDPMTGVVTVFDPSKLDFETAAGHTYSVTVQASNGTLAKSQAFTIAVTDVAPLTPVDSDASDNTIVEGAANGSTVGITASSADINGPSVTYSLTSDTSGGGFTINSTTGIITVADATKIDFESSGPNYGYVVTAQASDGILTSSQTFTIAVTNARPSNPIDSDPAANIVAEGAAAGTPVGVTVFSHDINGPPLTYVLIGDTSHGGFAVNYTTGVVTVADPTKLNFESSGPSHSYYVTAQVSDGASISRESFTIDVANERPSNPIDSDPAANIVAEGAAAGTPVGVTVSSHDVNGPPLTYVLIGDTSHGGFAVNYTTGVVTVADPTKLDYESSGPSHSYYVTAQVSDGASISRESFTIDVANAPPSMPIDSDPAANTVAEGAAKGTPVGVTVSSHDINGPALTYVLIGDTSHGGFAVDFATGVVTVADPTKLNFDNSGPSHSYSITAQVSDGAWISRESFAIAVTEPASVAPVNDRGVIAGTAVNDTVNSDHGGPILIWGAGADNFAFGHHIDSPASAPPLAHITELVAAHNDSFHFSAQTSSIHHSSMADASPVQAIDASWFVASPARTDPGVDVFGLAPDTGAHRMNVAGDTANAFADSHMAAHLPPIHFDWLV